MTAIDCDDAFANSAYIAGSEALPDQWAARAAAYRASGVRIDADIAYADRPREVMDIIWPDTTPKGLVVFIHGGYWMMLDKSSWTDLAEGARANGWAVCLPSYDLTPDVRISDITQQIGVAIASAAAHVDGPIHIAGHSAGGHLAARMVCDDTPLPPAVLTRVDWVVSISGLHDLRPLMRTKMNDVLHLDEAEACRESAALHRPAKAHRLTCWVGGGERPEFVRQSKLLAHMWAGLDVDTSCVLDADHDHFSVLEGLKDRRSTITHALLGDSA